MRRSIEIALMSSVISAFLSSGITLLIRMPAECSPPLVTPLASSAVAEALRLDMGGITPWLAELGGRAYKYPLPLTPADSADTPKQSPFLLIEDGVPLGPAHSEHEAIDKEGRGRYSHWQGWLIFSTSDNSDPRTNGRAYSIVRGGK